MGRRREEASLRALARKVWGDSYYERFERQRAGRRHRLTAVAGIGVGGPLLLSALAMIAFSTAASAHTSAINISCTQVAFTYRSFPAGVSATAHESVKIDNNEVAQRDFVFIGPSSSDTIPISVGSGTHAVHVSVSWTFNGQPQGSTYGDQQLSYCAPSTTTTAPRTSTTTTTCPPTTTSTTVPATTTSTSTTSTTIPETTTSSTAPATTTSTSSTTTTSEQPTTT